MTKRFPEFPSDWHQEAYIAGLKRELEGARVRGDDAYAKNVLDELKRLGEGEHASAPKKRGRPKRSSAKSAAVSSPKPEEPKTGVTTGGLAPSRTAAK